MLINILLNVLSNMCNKFIWRISKLAEEGDCHSLLERVECCEIPWLEVLMKESAVSSKTIVIG